MSYSFCSDDFTVQPYWWKSTPRPLADKTTLPGKTDVLVIGSGYTGLQSALQTVQAGRHTTIIDAEDLGWGCSSRNGGQISGEIKPDFDQLKRRYGGGDAISLIREARTALDWLGEFVEAQQIDCDYRRCGRFVAAHSPRQFRKLLAQAEKQTPGLEQALDIIEPSDQSNEIDSSYYHGGMIVDNHCSLDPAKYHSALLQKVQASGAETIDHCAAIHIETNKAGFRVTTSQGVIQTNELVIATNGYSGNLAPWQQRRVIPIGSYMLATEAMPLERAEKLMPKNRVFSDTRKIVVYFRRSPDGRSLIFGGRVSVYESNPIKSLPALRQEMLRIFPQLEDVKISHTWMGFVAYTFDELPHLGKKAGIHYAMGYCGSGICLASYLGHRLGQQLLGKKEGATAFDEPRFQTRPFYTGNPWFLAPSVRYYQMIDRFS
ncbi:MAG: glycine/D-amino acid oxidase-like deaminating enzyme [Gammaproteobacteria bacterium]|jgi:glycine/D-amino acid oxidase-like deaminating enzyme